MRNAIIYLKVEQIITMHKTWGKQLIDSLIGINANSLMGGQSLINILCQNGSFI